MTRTGTNNVLLDDVPVSKINDKSFYVSTSIRSESTRPVLVLYGCSGHHEWREKK